MLPSCAQQFGQSGEVSGRQRQDEARPDALDAAEYGLRAPADGLGPAKSLFDPLAVLERQSIALVPGGAPVDRGMTGSLGEVRRDTSLPQVATNSAASCPLSAPNVSRWVEPGS